MQNIFFSIIILSHNNEYIELVIDTITEQCSKEDEIIIVDDHSSRDYLDNLKKITSNNSQMKLIQAIKRGNRSHNRNLGVAHSDNSILLFIDGDMVLIDNALNILRKAHAKRTEIAFVGPKHNIHFDAEHFKLYSGIHNYIDKLKTSSGRRELAESHLFPDERASFFADINNQEFDWMHYYTGASSVEREVFEECGGFDESFETWGSEDVDFGYRIHKHGNIGFLNNFHSFHIPHPRNAFDVESTNMQNILKMVKKYKTWEFEALYAFNGHPSVHHSFKNIISQMRTLTLNDTPIEPNQNISWLLVDTISSRYPNGYIKTQEGNATNILNLLGLALPYPTDSFDEVYISDHIFIYPIIITSRIIQECVRVGKKVYIQATAEQIRINWSQMINLSSAQTNHKIAYRSEDIMDYRFEEQEGRLVVTPALPINVLRSPIFWENTHDVR